MYDRRVEGKLLQFGHEGKLYRNSFVMYDTGTRSLWVHVTGEAVTGPMRGKLLRQVPSDVTTWGAWKRAHPGTRVALGDGRRGFMGTFNGLRTPEGFGLSLFSGGKAKLYEYGVLKRERVVQDQFDGQPVLLVFVEGTGMAWRRESGGRTLTFSVSKKDMVGEPMLLEDRETGSVWSAVRGLALEGELKGTALERLATTPILLARWRGFYPDGEQYRPGK